MNPSYASVVLEHLGRMIGVSENGHAPTRPSQRFTKKMPLETESRQMVLSLSRGMSDNRMFDGIDRHLADVVEQMVRRDHTPMDVVDPQEMADEIVDRFQELVTGYREPELRQRVAAEVSRRYPRMRKRVQERMMMGRR